LVPLQITIDVPAGAPVATYNAILTVTNSVTGCVSANIPITIKVNANPVIVPGANPSVCAGVTTALLPYGGAVGADQYSLDFDPTAEGEGFVDVAPFTALTAGPSQIVISIPVGPGDGNPGTYLADLTIRNSATLCTATIPIQVVINPNPTITLDFTNPKL